MLDAAVCNEFTSREAAWRALEKSREWLRVVHSTERRMELCESQNWRCCYCGVWMFAGEPRECMLQYMRAAGISRRRSNNKLIPRRQRLGTIEHLRRLADGGTDLRENLAAACAWCNNNRGERTPEQWFEDVQVLIVARKHPHGVLAYNLFG